MKTRWRYCLAIGSFFVLSLTEPASAHDGWIEVRDDPGLGVTVVEDVVRQYSFTVES